MGHWNCTAQPQYGRFPLWRYFSPIAPLGSVAFASAFGVKIAHPKERSFRAVSTQTNRKLVRLSGRAKIVSMMADLRKARRRII
jgi:hypothetical protein